MGKTVSNSFKSKVKYNIGDENKANKEYRQMAKKAPTKTDRKTLQEMARDEADHKKKLTVIQRKLDKKR